MLRFQLNLGLNTISYFDLQRDKEPPECGFVAGSESMVKGLYLIYLDRTTLRMGRRFVKTDEISPLFFLNDLTERIERFQKIIRVCKHFRSPSFDNCANSLIQFRETP